MVMLTCLNAVLSGSRRSATTQMLTARPQFWDFPQGSQEVCLPDVYPFSDIYPLLLFFFEKEICAKKSSSFKAQRQMLSKPDNISYCVQPFFCKTCNPQKIWNCIAKYFCQVFSTLLQLVLKIIQRSESIFSPRREMFSNQAKFW